MKNIVNKTANTVATLHGTTFTVFFIIDTVLNEFLYPYMEKHLTSDALRVFITAVIAAFLYSAIYFVVKAIYDGIILKKDKKMDIAGKWYHVHIPHVFGRVDYSKKKLRAGVTVISRELYDFTFVGDNYYSLKDASGNLIEDHSDDTRWYTKTSKLSEINDFDMIEIYEAKTKNAVVTDVKECPCCRTKFDQPKRIQEAERFRHGIHKFDMILDENGKCNKIVGEFSDCWPSLKSGDLILFRNKEERDQYVTQYFACGELNATK